MMFAWIITIGAVSGWLLNVYDPIDISSLFGRVVLPKVTLVVTSVGTSGLSLRSPDPKLILISILVGSSNLVLLKSMVPWPNVML